MGNRYIVVVDGYVRKDVFEVADRWIGEQSGAEYERHVYAWNSEGFMLHIISNVPLSEDLIDATFNGEFTDEEEDIHWEEVDGEYYLRPIGGVATFTGPNYRGEWHTVGRIVGYEYAGDERYEC